MLDELFNHPRARRALTGARLDSARLLTLLDSAESLVIYQLDGTD